MNYVNSTNKTFELHAATCWWDTHINQVCPCRDVIHACSLNGHLDTVAITGNA